MGLPIVEVMSRSHLTFFQFFLSSETRKLMPVIVNGEYTIRFAEADERTKHDVSENLVFCHLIPES